MGSVKIVAAPPLHNTENMDITTKEYISVSFLRVIIVVGQVLKKVLSVFLSGGK